jgi:hypothetical protein
VPNELTIAMDLTGADHHYASLADVPLRTLLDGPPAT